MALRLRECRVTAKSLGGFDLRLEVRLERSARPVISRNAPISSEKITTKITVQPERLALARIGR
jgi:hypothetical protein